MSKYAFPFEYDDKISTGMTERAYLAGQVLNGLAANPNLVDVTNIVRSGDDATPELRQDENENQRRLVAFARHITDMMMAELNTVPAGV